MNLPTSSDARADWMKLRRGIWTGSMIGDLMTPARSLSDEELDAYGAALGVDLPREVVTKTGPNAGKPRRNPEFNAAVRKAIDEAGLVLFGDTALSAIASKAAERLSGEAEASPTTYSMTRGLELEPVARLLLSETWRRVDNCPFCPLDYEVPAGATPDGLVDNGAAVLDIKCPERIGKLVSFAMNVRDEDFESLESWDRGYAWQIMMEALCAGVDHAWLVYFTDRIPAIRTISGEPVFAWIERNAPGGYLLESGGFAFVARRFTLTAERKKRILRTLAAAEIECEKIVAAMKAETTGGWALLGTERPESVIVEAAHGATAPTHVEPVDDLGNEDNGLTDDDIATGFAMLHDEFERMAEAKPEPEDFVSPAPKRTDAELLELLRVKLLEEIDEIYMTTNSEIFAHGLGRLHKWVEDWARSMKKDL